MGDQYDQCVSVYEYTLKLYCSKDMQGSEVAECWYNLGNAHFKLNNRQEAIKAFQSAKKYDTPDDLLLKIEYAEGLAYAGAKDWQAVEKFRKCQLLLGEECSHDLYESTHYHLGVNLHLHKQYEEAIEAFTTLVERGCDDQCVYEMRGKVYL